MPCTCCAPGWPPAVRARRAGGSRAGISTSCPGTCSSARPAPARRRPCCMRACAFRSPSGSARRRSPGSAARGNATGGSPTRRCSSTRPAATRRRTARRRATRRSGRPSCSCCASYRPVQPINGVIVTVSVPDLLQGGAELEHQAVAVDRRLQELRAQLGQRFPVYLLVTKADLLAGFVEFFGDFDAAQREQVWGLTFDAGARSAGQPLPQDLHAQLATLPARIAAMTPRRLQDEPLVQRRAAIYHFAAQLDALLPALEGFARRAFRGAAEAPAQLVRGVHLSSGTQEGNPIDRVLGELSRNYGMALRTSARARRRRQGLLPGRPAAPPGHPRGAAGGLEPAAAPAPALAVSRTGRSGRSAAAAGLRGLGRQLPQQPAVRRGGPRAGAQGGEGDRPGPRGRHRSAAAAVRAAATTGAQRHRRAGAFALATRLRAVPGAAPGPVRPADLPAGARGDAGAAAGAAADTGNPPGVRPGRALRGPAHRPDAHHAATPATRRGAAMGGAGVSRQRRRCRAGARCRRAAGVASPPRRPARAQCGARSGAAGRGQRDVRACRAGGVAVRAACA